MNPLTPNTIFFVDGSGLKNCAHQAVGECHLEGRSGLTPFPQKVTAILDGELKEAIEKLLAFDAPLALISYSSSQLLIARDAYGRESLLHSKGPDGVFISCFETSAPGSEENVQESLEWRDVPPGSVTLLDFVTKKAEFHTILTTRRMTEDMQMHEGSWVAALELIFPEAHIVRHENLGEQFFAVSPDIGSLLEMDSRIDEFLLHGTSELRQLLEAELECRETIAIAFSGGVDSLLMGHLLARILAEGHEVDLINVAFGETPRECSQAPDRQRGLAGFEELRTNYPKIAWRLICSNVSMAEIEKQRLVIPGIVRPCDTVLDESLGFVLWFALRGIGLVDEETTVSSTARKFVVGSGADELCAGYSRHKHRLEKEGAPGLQDELEMELVRYGWRNGSRDARVALYHGRRLVAPFLVGTLAKFCRVLPLAYKCEAEKARGVGDKLIIREALRASNSSFYKTPKQAMQFGSRFAKKMNGDKTIKGTDRAAALRNSGRGDTPSEYEV